MPRRQPDPNQADPRQPGGRYFSGYWRHEYTVDTMFTTVYPSADGSGWSRGTVFFDVTWIPSEAASHPRQSGQWAGDGFRTGRHCTPWDARSDEIVSQPGDDGQPCLICGTPVPAGVTLCDDCDAAVTG